MAIKTIKQNVLRKIKPDVKDEQKLEAFIEKLLSVSKEISGLEAVMCGSIGKHTWLKGDYDIDLFLMFPSSTTRDDLEKRGLEYGRKIAKRLDGAPIIKYAEHPYTRIHANNFFVDVVPCYGISPGDKIISAVDRSPLHRKYVLEKLHPTLRDEVRLLKQFCKGIGVYGSDTRRQGFSGYVCELLVINYGKFETVLKNAMHWKPQTVIDTENISAVKFSDALVMIDPIDPNRNVAANVSGENFIKFVNASGKFIFKPDISYFFEQGSFLLKNERESLKKRGTTFLALKMTAPNVVEDTLFPQLRKTMKRISAILHDEEFSVMRSMAFANSEMYLIFELGIWSQPCIRKMQGPAIFSKKHAKEFTEKYGPGEFSPYVEEGIWYAEKERKFRDAASLIKDISSRASEEMGIPNHIVNPLKKALLLENESFWKDAERNMELSYFLKKKYFDRLV